MLKKNEIIIYPNPFKKIIIIKISNYNLENLLDTIYDLNGNLIEKPKVSYLNKNAQIKTNNYTKRVYILKIDDTLNNTTSTYKFLIK